jgi:2-keto-4-pentenoate hydratase/2-oxohepta-3-ene-1,7-dioic acid hydratase in catechol pathway
MLLFRFGEKDQEKPGVVIGETKKDCSAHFTDWNQEFFNNNGLEALKSLVDDGGGGLPDVPDGIRYGSCVARPGTLMCIGLNYSDHAEESGMEPPPEPVIFQKVSNAVIGPYDDVIIPKGSRKTDWEVELGVVIGQDALYLDSVEEAENYIAGYCISQDVSERAFQLEREGQWTKGKSCPTFNPLGPYLHLASDIGDANNLAMELKVNGEIKQTGNIVFSLFYRIKI